MDKDVLRNQIESFTGNADFEYSIEIKTNQNILYQYNSDKQFLSASLIKIVITDYALKFEQTNPSFIDDYLLIDESEIVGGAGIIKGLSERKWRIKDLVYLMLNASDNTATNVLISYFSLNVLKHWADCQFNHVVIGRYMMKQGISDNVINLSELMPIWEEIFDKKTRLSKIIIDALHHQQNKRKLEGILSNIPFEGKTYNKTGELANEEHDIARFKLNNEWVDCAVLTHFKSESQRIRSIEFIQNIGFVVARNMQNSD